MFRLEDLLHVTDQPALQWWIAQRKLLPKLLRQGFDSLFFLIGWSIWKERNAQTFDAVSTPAQQLALSIVDEATEWSRAGFRKLGALINR
jgi:hypothetical protein